MTFEKWMNTLKPHNNPRGDFIKDWRADDPPEWKIQTWTDLETFLVCRNACDGAIEAAKVVWKEWQNVFTGEYEADPVAGDDRFGSRRRSPERSSPRP